jgi:alginate O-acetyltransferase complex protein AlgI
MAIGLSWMFNIRLPFNFNSPYRATSIIDFWRRWHISLSNFCATISTSRSGGSRRGSIQRYVNLMVTMLLGGLWHGASWSFVIWGGLHGLYLMVNHGFRAAVGARTITLLDQSRLFGAFRLGHDDAVSHLRLGLLPGGSFSGCLRVLRGMAGLQKIDTVHPLLWNAGLMVLRAYSGVWRSAVLAFLAPNSNRVGRGSAHFALPAPGMARSCRQRFLFARS